MVFTKAIKIGRNNFKETIVIATRSARMSGRNFLYMVTILPSPLLHIAREESCKGTSRDLFLPYSPKLPKIRDLVSPYCSTNSGRCIHQRFSSCNLLKRKNISQLDMPYIDAHASAWGCVEDICKFFRYMIRRMRPTYLSFSVLYFPYIIVYSYFSSNLIFHASCTVIPFFILDRFFANNKYFQFAHVYTTFLPLHSTKIMWRIL